MYCHQYAGFTLNDVTAALSASFALWTLGLLLILASPCSDLVLYFISCTLCVVMLSPLLFIILCVASLVACFLIPGCNLISPPWDNKLDLT